MVFWQPRLALLLDAESGGGGERQARASSATEQQARAVTNGSVSEHGTSWDFEVRLRAAGARMSEAGQGTTGTSYTCGAGCEDYLLNKEEGRGRSRQDSAGGSEWGVGVRRAAAGEEAHFGGLLH